jgi:predicted RNase H-like HicB family nuclease
MKTIKIIIEKTKDLFTAYAENIEGIYGAGNSVKEVKQSILDAIRLTKEHNTDANIPQILKGDYEIVYKLDVPSFLNYYKGIFTNSALEKITGINQKQIQHYATGYRIPRQAQVKKIETALHQFGSELLAVEL